MIIERPSSAQRSLHRALAGLLIAALAVWFIPASVLTPAAAAVLEGAHVLELTAASMGRITALQADQKLWIYPYGSEAEPTQVDETVTYLMPERFRSDLVSERIQRTHLVFADHSLTVIDGRMTVGSNPFDSYQELLRSRSRPRLIRTLNRLGVQTAISSLGRLEEQVVYVLGARYPDESASQLAVDQATFLPLRLLLQLNPDSDNAPRRLEIFYREWRKVENGWFPMQVVFYTDGRLAREIRVADLRSNPSIPSDLLDLEALKRSVSLQEALSPREQKTETVETLQQQLRDFQKKFE